MRGALGRLAGVLILYGCLYGGEWLLHIHGPKHTSAWTIVAVIAWFTGAYIAGTIAHELGHAVAVRAVGERVLGIELGGKIGRVTFTLGTIPVSIGLGPGGSVTFGHRLSARRRAVVVAAGPAANILVAPLCMLLPLPRSEAALLMLAILASGLQNLVPGTAAGDGELSDGGKLWRTPARLRADKEVRTLLADPSWQQQPGAADVLIKGFRLDVPEAEDCLRALSKQPDAVLRIYQQAWTLPDRPEADVLHIIDVLSTKVLLTGDLTAETADLVASRAQWVIEHLDSEHPDERLPLWSARQTLALARLRQGRAAEVRRLCADALAADIDADDRATTLAIVAMARHALLLDGRPQLQEAESLDPDALMVQEAARVLGGSRESAAAPAQRAAS
jgi:Peptidase family M50